MLRSRLDMIKRYASKDTSSLAFWWLPLYEGNGDYNLGIDKECDYYLDFSEKAKYTTLFDEDGVIMLDYKGALGIQYNPCSIAQYGLGLYSQYLKCHDESYLKKACVQADWLVDLMRIDEKDIGRLEYTFSEDSKVVKTIKENTISSISQGQAVSLLLRLYVTTKNEKYKYSADKMINAFKYMIFDGGVVNYDDEHRMYLEESITEKVSCILDGFMYAMFGVYDYYLITKDQTFKEIFDECCRTLKERLPDFDLKYWSRADCYFDKPKVPASSFYHNVHIQQLKALYKITDEKTFDKYAKKFEKYQKNFLCRKIAFIKKCWFKLFYY